MKENKERTWFELQRLENFGRGPTPEPWVLARSYPESEKDVAIAYRDGANTQQPGCWRLVKLVEVEETEVVTTVETYWSLSKKEVL